MKKTILKTFIVLGIAIAVLYPVLNRYYFYPKKWKKAFYEISQSKYKELDKSRISLYTDCMYTYFSSKYGSVNIPEPKNYTKEDIKGGLICVIDNLIDGDSTKNYAKIHIDEIVNTMWEESHK